jgi:hypothetical protein
MKVRVSVDMRGFTALVNRVKHNVGEALEQGVREGGRTVTQYIKYDLLDGQLVQKRTGALQRGIYYTVRGKHQVVVHIRGEREQVAEWLEEGIQKTWLIPVKRVGGSPGQWNRGRIISQEWWHPGIKARRFMHKAATDKRAEIQSNIQRLVNSAVRS